MSNLKEMRLRANVTQKQAAEAIGVTVQSISGYERDTREINFVDAITLADLYGCTLDELAGRQFPKATMSLSAEERHVVDVMRSTDDRGRAAIRAIADSQAGDAGLHEDDASEVI